MDNNQMKMREALDRIGNIAGFVSENCGDQQTAKYMNDIISEVQSSLSAPPRNFERYDTAEAAWNAYDEWVESYEAKRETPPYNEFGWLYALANQEMRGENHGSK